MQMTNKNSGMQSDIKSYTCRIINIISILVQVDIAMQFFFGLALSLLPRCSGVVESIVIMAGIKVYAI